MINTLRSLFTRDLSRLSKEILLYTNERNLWIMAQQINNSAGNLCLHLLGNLNSYIGKEIGDANYTRDRDAEFSLKDIPRETLLQRIAETSAIINRAFDQFDEDDLSKEYPVLVFDEKTSYEFMLIHLSTHLAYHLGQINYHRRLLDH
ncbi:MAG: DinB superfamily protein [Ferruginibacter sp.]|nr:DinB superfamily protein [Ferruginibacter sp.]